MRALPLLVLALCLAPTAGACSLAGPVPGPGAFLVTPLAGDGEPWRVEVRGRMLGGTCELSNPHALDGDALAWVEVGQLEASAPRSVHVGWRDGAEVVHRDVTRQPVDAFAMKDGVILLYAKEFLRMDARTGAREPLPFPEGDWYPVLAEGSVVVALRRDVAAERASLYAYDAASGAWLAEGLDLESLGLPWFSGPREVTERHAVFQLPGSDAYRLVDLRMGEARDAPEVPGGLLDVDGAWAYGHGPLGLVRVSLADGGRDLLGPADWNVVSVQQGHVVTGTYGPGLAPPPSDAAAWVLVGAMGMGALGGLAWGARRGRRR